MKAIVIAALSLLLIGCAKSPAVSWLQDFSTWEQQSPNQPYSIQKDENNKRHFTPSLRFELKSGEGWVNHGEKTFRSEISTNTFAPIFSEQWYGFSLLIPNDFPIEKNRTVIVQWWSPTKKELDEKGKSPALAFRFENATLYANVKTSPERVVKETTPITIHELFSIADFPKGSWQDFIVNTKWSYKSDGFVKIWHNQQQIADYKGPVGYNDDAGPMMKFGIYRDASDKTYILNIDQVRIGKSYKEVDPSQK
jgi:hypothetical protein